MGSFKLYRFANKIPLLYDEGSDVAREVISEVEINKMGISKKEVKEQFRNAETRSDRAIEYLPIHIFFHICSTKIPYKTAGKESIAAEGDLKRYMKSCLSDLYRKVSAQIRRELKIKENENKLRLYKYYIPFIVNAISDSIRIDVNKLTLAFNGLAVKYICNDLAITTNPGAISNPAVKDGSSPKEKISGNIKSSKKAIYPDIRTIDRKRKHESSVENDKKSTQITLDAFRKSKLRKV